MKQKNSLTNNLLLGLFILSLLALSRQIQQKPTHAVSPNVVISEIQIAGTAANDEFVELYNPTNQAVDLTGWRLSRRSSSATGSLTNLVSSLSGSIQPRGYFLLANPAFTSTQVDQYYSATTSGVAANNTVILFSDNGQTVVDKVGMGTAEDNETASSVLPEAGQSIERKANANATAQSMQGGGSDEFQGNGWDSDSNLNDFVARTIPQPQHSQSSLEPVLSPSPSQTPSPALSPSPTVVPSPTQTPSPTPSLTTTPTVTPTPEPTPSPTAIPSPTATPQPSPSPTVIPTPTTTVLPTPTPRVIEYQFPNSTLVCTWKTRRIDLKFLTIVLPTFHCLITK